MVAQFNIFKPPDLIQFQVAADMVEIFLKPTKHISNFIGSAQISHRIGN